MSRLFVCRMFPPRCCVAVVVVLAVAGCSSESGDPCTGVGCSSRGFCLADQGVAYCACIPGYHPVALSCAENDPDDPCLGIDCSDHGRCVVVVDDPTCDCDSGYHHLADYELQCVADVLDGPSDAPDAPDAGPDGSCLAVPETANLRDDDCDGLTDEGLLDISCTDDAPCAPSLLICNERWGLCVVPTCYGWPDTQPCETITSPDRSYDICRDGTCVSPGCGDADCNASGPYYPPGDTGQRTCYDASTALGACPGAPRTPACETTDFCGQDAQYGWDQECPGCARFSRTSDAEPTVIDGVTLLTWQGCSLGQTGSACTGTAEALSWSAAVSACDDLVWDGHSDWRLPDEFELQSLVDYDRSAGVRIDTTAFPATPARDYWTSSSYAMDTAAAWVLDFSTGLVNWNEKTDAATSARCIRGGGPRRIRFVRTMVGGDPVVTDVMTGLAWPGCPVGMTGDAASCTGTALYTTWQTALDACQDLVWAGFDDWYLPDTKQLGTLHDNGRYWPAIDAEVFPGAPFDYFFWSSTTSAVDATRAWSVSFSFGRNDVLGKSGSGYVRCVRDRG